MNHSIEQPRPNFKKRSQSFKCCLQSQDLPKQFQIMLNVNLFLKEQPDNQVSSMKETLLLERTSNLPIEKAVFNQSFNISLNSTHNFYNSADT